MTPEQGRELEQILRTGVPLSLSLYRSICGEDVNIVEDLMEGRVPESLRAELWKRMDRMSIIEYRLSRMQDQLDRIEAKLSQ